MGQEINCKARFNGKSSEGLAMLETNYVLFRGDFRAKIAFASMKSVRSEDGWLKIASKDGDLALQLGARAEKWADRILHPPSRIDKLGVKPGMRVSIAGSKDDRLASEIRERGAAFVKSDSDILFYTVDRKPALDRLAALVDSIKSDGAIWIVYPKGIREITEIDVISAIRAAGLKDVKVASYSASHTALKAVIPVAQRAAR